MFVAVDEGVLTKSGPDVTVSVRRAMVGADLDHLREVVEQEFLQLDEQERGVRVALAKMETGFIRRMAAFQNE